MSDILHTIIAHKRIELQEYPPLQIPNPELKHTPISMKDRLSSSSTGIIAEFKHKSPSKGWINQYADPAKVAAGYSKAGASAMSVLTDGKFFGGSVSDLITVRQTVDLPILRKDFIIDCRQILEASIIGADAVLLIAAALSESQCQELAAYAHSLGLETLLEIHSEDELRYFGKDIDMIGVNNRHLGSFVTDVKTSFDLASMLPKDVTLVSESGISKAETVAKLRDAGFKGFLIGETFMSASEPDEALNHFISALKELTSPDRLLVKVCGMRDADNIKDIEATGIDMMGFIFAEESKRKVSVRPGYLPKHCKRTGVFVNQDLESIINIVNDWGLDYVQLHGEETPGMCRMLRSRGIRVIKALQVSDTNSLRLAERYYDSADLLLFDTASTMRGGSGKHFDWDILAEYDGPVDFLLSGGISADDAGRIASIKHPKFVGIDVNSRFETEPGIKDVKKLRNFIKTIKR